MGATEVLAIIFLTTLSLRPISSSHGLDVAFTFSVDVFCLIVLALDQVKTKATIKLDSKLLSRNPEVHLLPPRLDDLDISFIPHTTDSPNLIARTCYIPNCRLTLTGFHITRTRLYQNLISISVHKVSINGGYSHESITRDLGLFLSEIRSNAASSSLGLVCVAKENADNAEVTNIWVQTPSSVGTNSVDALPMSQDNETNGMYLAAAKEPTEDNGEEMDHLWELFEDNEETMDHLWELFEDDTIKKDTEAMKKVGQLCCLHPLKTWSRKIKSRVRRPNLAKVSKILRKVSKIFKTL